MNTIGAVFTEFFMLGLTTLVVFLLSNVVVGVLSQAPDLSTGLRHISLGALTLVFATAVTIALLLAGGALAWVGLTFGSLFVVVAWMVMSTAGDQGLTIILFALASVAAPALLILLLRRLF